MMMFGFVLLGLWLLNTVIQFGAINAYYVAKWPRLHITNGYGGGYSHIPTKNEARARIDEQIHSSFWFAVFPLSMFMIPFFTEFYKYGFAFNKLSMLKLAIKRKKEIPI